MFSCERLSRAERIRATVFRWRSWRECRIWWSIVRKRSWHSSAKMTSPRKYRILPWRQRQATKRCRHTTRWICSRYHYLTRLRTKTCWRNCWKWMWWIWRRWMRWIHCTGCRADWKTGGDRKRRIMVNPIYRVEHKIWSIKRLA